MTVQPNEIKQNEPQPQNPAASPKPEPSPAQKNHRTKLLLIFSAIIFVVGLVWFLLWIFYLQFHMSTDDAYANGSIVNINSPIDGTIIAFYADNTDLVLQGELLAKLDTTYFQVAYERSLASLAEQALQIKEVFNEVQVNQADIEIKKVNASRARFNYENRSQLIGSKAVSNEEFIHSRDELTIAENDLKKSQYQLKASKELLGTTSLEMHPSLEEKKSAVREAYCNLKHCDLYAPITGYVAMRSVNVGQSVTRTTNLMAIIPTDYVWVDANFKETQLIGMRIGQPASVWFDLYGSDVKFDGKVLGIASGSGSIFSLIPPQNATGNWIKIVQRLPVRIGLDPEALRKYPIRLGISAEVDVDISDKDLPFMQSVITTKPISATTVYDIQLDEVNQIIDSVIKVNLMQQSAQ